MQINLGAGAEIEQGYVNVDWIDQDGIDIVHNLLIYPWPFESDIADRIMARDVLEHMPNFTPDNKSNPIVFVEEAHRILKVGGELFMTMPHWQSKNCWIDLTHVKGFDERSFDYFDESTELGKAYGYYSDRKFKVTSIRTPNDNVEVSMIKI